MSTASATYTAVLVGRHSPEHRTTYPGVLRNDDGGPAARIRIRYTGDLGTSRVTTYTLVDTGDSADDERAQSGSEPNGDVREAHYAWQSDEDYTPGPPDEDDWLIDAPGLPPQ